MLAARVGHKHSPHSPATIEALSGRLGQPLSQSDKAVQALDYYLDTHYRGFRRKRHWQNLKQHLRRRLFLSPTTL